MFSTVLSPYAGARVATIVVIKFTKKKDHTQYYTPFMMGIKLIPTFRCHYWLCHYHISGSTYLDFSKILKTFF